METQALKDLASFLAGVDFVSSHDATMIVSLFSRLPVTRVKLESHADDHMEMASDIAYLASKYQQIYRKAESARKFYAGGIQKEHRRRELPQYTINGLLDNTPEYLVLVDDATDKWRVSDHVDRLSWAMKQRETMINYYRKLDGF